MPNREIRVLWGPQDSDDSYETFLEDEKGNPPRFVLIKHKGNPLDDDDFELLEYIHVLDEYVVSNFLIVEAWETNYHTKRK